MQRQSANLKLKPKILIKALVASVLSGFYSLRQIAIEVGLLLNDATYSKQALWDRLDENTVGFVRAVVGEALQQSIQSVLPLQLKALPGVRRILVGDSSTFRFHPSLREHFPGGSNQHGVSCAQNRFQLTFDLLGGKWLQAQSDPYKRNDRSAAGDIVSSLVQKSRQQAPSQPLQTSQAPGSDTQQSPSRPAELDSDGDQSRRERGQRGPDLRTLPVALAHRKHFQSRQEPDQAQASVEAPQQSSSHRRADVGMGAVNGAPWDEESVRDVGV